MNNKILKCYFIVTSLLLCIPNSNMNNLQFMQCIAETTNTEIYDVTKMANSNNDKFLNEQKNKRKQNDSEEVNRKRKITLFTILGIAIAVVIVPLAFLTY